MTCFEIVDVVLEKAKLWGSLAWVFYLVSLLSFYLPEIQTLSAECFF